MKVQGESRRGAGREGHGERYSSFSASSPGTRRKEDVNLYEEREEREYRPHQTEIFEEEDRHREHRPSDRVDRIEIERDHHRDSGRHHADTEVKFEVDRRERDIDVTERDYSHRSHRPAYDVEYERARPHGEQEHRMGYYDDEGHYHSFRHGLEKAADRVFHPFHPRHEHEREDVIIEREERDRGPTRIREGQRETIRYIERGGRHHASNTITIPCHHIRIGDLLILQGRPCQVIRITTSAQTGQHRYLGVDLFTKQLHEESSFVSNPTPSVIVQNMLGPVFKTYRVLDMREDGRVVAMTETGDVKQGLPVIDQDGLWSRLNESFANGRGSVRVLVINDGGRELAVDYKVIHGSRL